eukprot:365644-Chlamydomonas_euryale.AAC.2
MGHRMMSSEGSLLYMHGKPRIPTPHAWQATGPCPTCTASHESPHRMHGKPRVYALHAWQATNPHNACMASHGSLPCMHGKPRTPTLHAWQATCPCPACMASHESLPCILPPPRCSGGQVPTCIDALSSASGAAMSLAMSPGTTFEVTLMTPTAPHS